MYGTQIQPWCLAGDLSLNLHIRNPCHCHLDRHSTRWLARTDHADTRFRTGRIGSDFLEQQANRHRNSVGHHWQLIVERPHSDTVSDGALAAVRS